jgi:hypothetical protein
MEFAFCILASRSIDVDVTKGKVEDVCMYFCILDSGGV